MSVFNLKYLNNNNLTIPNNYTISEFLSNIYCVSNGFSSVIKERKAPQKFLKLKMTINLNNTDK